MIPPTRPLSPHLTIYRWQIQMVSSILHRITGILLVLGALWITIELLALASGSDAFGVTQQLQASPIGTALLLGWTWAFSYHLLNGLRHLLQDVGWGFAVRRLVCNSWLTVLGSLVLMAAIWLGAIALGGTI